MIKVTSLWDFKTCLEIAIDFLIVVGEAADLAVELCHHNLRAEVWRHLFFLRSLRPPSRPTNAVALQQLFQPVHLGWQTISLDSRQLNHSFYASFMPGETLP